MSSPFSIFGPSQPVVIAMFLLLTSSFVRSFILFFFFFFSFHEHLLSTYCVPGTVLGAGDTSVTNTQSLSLRSSQSIGGATYIKTHS